MPAQTRPKAASDQPRAPKPRRANHHQCGNRFASSAAAAGGPASVPAWLRSPKLHLRVASRPGVVLVVSMARVSHVPAVTDPSTLTLCPCYDPGAGEHRPRCKAPPGDTCPFVHADVRRASEYRPHERALAHTYQRFATEPAERLVLVQRSSKDVAAGRDVIPASELLRTRALDSSTVAVAHCVHFAKKGRCDRGAECLFVHHVPAAPSTPSVSTTTSTSTAASVSTPDFVGVPVKPYRDASPRPPPLIELIPIAATPDATDTTEESVAVACFLCAAVARARVDPQRFGQMRTFAAVFPGCRIASRGLRSRRLRGELSANSSTRRRSSGPATPVRPPWQHSPYGALSLSSRSSAATSVDGAAVPAGALP